MFSEPRKQLMAWMEMDYSKHMHFQWKIKWRLEHSGTQRVMGEMVLQHVALSGLCFVERPKQLVTTSFMYVFGLPFGFAGPVLWWVKGWVPVSPESVKKGKEKRKKWISYKLHWIMSPYIHYFQGPVTWGNLLLQLVLWDIYVFMQFDAVIVAWIQISLNSCDTSWRQNVAHALGPFMWQACVTCQCKNCK